MECCCHVSVYDYRGVDLMKIDKETKKLLLISFLIVMAGLFIIHGEEMAAITIGQTNWVSVTGNESIAASYQIPGRADSKSCEVELMYYRQDGTGGTTSVGSVIHSNSKSVMTGTFPMFKIANNGYYELVMEITHTLEDNQKTTTWQKVTLNVTTATGYVPDGNGGSNNNNSSDYNGSGGQPIIIGGDSGSSIEIIGNSSKNGSTNGSNNGSNNTENVSGNRDDDGNFLGPKWSISIPKSLKEMVERFFENMKTLKRLINGEVSLADVFKDMWEAVLDIIENGMDLENLPKFLANLLIIAAVLAAAVLVVYFILKIAAWRIIKKISG